jgi:hypothetical protein
MRAIALDEKTQSYPDAERRGILRIKIETKRALPQSNSLTAG